MPFCPNCRYEYRRGIETCSDCGAQLVDELPDETPVPPPPIGNDVPIARAESLAIAEMWSELLQEENIGCRIVPAYVGDTMLVPGQSQWEVRVAASEAQRARELLPIGRNEAELPEIEDPEVADSAARNVAVRWLIIAVVVFLAIVILAVGIRSTT